MAMAMASSSSSHHGFLTGSSSFFPLINKNHSTNPHRGFTAPYCRSSMDKKEPEPNKNQKGSSQLAKVALVAAAAGVLLIGSPKDAVAAKSGGRVGGQAFRSSAPRSSGPRINNSRTNIYINPPVAPPLVGGYGYGVYGGWGWSPFSFFAPGPSVAVGVGGGFDFVLAILVFGAIATVVRRFSARRGEDEDDN